MPFLDEFVSEVLLKYPFQFVFAPLGNALGNLIKPCLASFVKGTVAPILIDVLGKAFTGIVNTVVFLIDKIGDLIQLFARLGTAIKNSPLGKLGAGIADIFSGGSKAGLSVNTLEGGAGGSFVSRSFTDQVAESLAKPVAHVLQPITDEFKRNVIGLVPGNPNGVNNAWIESLKDAVSFVVNEEGGFGVFNAQGQLTGGGGPGRIGTIPGSVTINVNAPSVIDEEGFARAVGTAVTLGIWNTRPASGRVPRLIESIIGRSAFDNGLIISVSWRVGTMPGAVVVSLSAARTYIAASSSPRNFARRVFSRYLALVNSKREQIDQTTEPGEQSFTGWWFRSQSSFHLGAGAKFFEQYLPTLGAVHQQALLHLATVECLNLQQFQNLLNTNS